MTGNNYAIWFSAISTFLLAIVALFKDGILKYFLRPIIELEFNLNSPDCFKNTLREKKDGKTGNTIIYFEYRFRVINNGKSTAKNVEVAIQEIMKKKGDKYFRIEAFLSDNLDWNSAFLNQDIIGKIYYDNIFSDTFKFCELGRILEPEKRHLIPLENNPKLSIKEKEDTIFSLNIIKRYNNLYFLLSPGTYKIKVLVAGENFKLIKKEYELEITGKWFEDEARMLNEGVKLKKTQI